MARGDKSKYTDKQKRKAEHIAESYEDRGVPAGASEEPRLGDCQQRSPAAAINPGAVGESPTPTCQARRVAGKAARRRRHRSAEERSASAKKAAATRKLHQGGKANS